MIRFAGSSQTRVSLALDGMRFVNVASTSNGPALKATASSPPRAATASATIPSS